MRGGPLLCVWILLVASCAGPEAPSASAPAPSSATAPTTNAATPTTTATPIDTATGETGEADASTTSARAGGWADGIPGNGAWSSATIGFAEPGLGASPILSIADVGDRLVAVTTSRDALTVWESVNGGDFTPLWTGSDSGGLLTTLVALDEQWLITGEGRDDGAALAIMSGDGGRTWTDVVDPDLVGDRNTRMRVVVTRDTAIGTVAGDDNGQPRSTLLRSDDLVNWEPVELPGRNGRGSVLVTSDGDRVWAIVGDLGGEDQAAIELWVSDDAGRTFATAGETSAPGPALVAVGGSIVLTPIVPLFFLQREPAPSPRRISGAGEVDLAVDRGQWGDGRASFDAVATDPESGRFFGLLSRVRRSNPLYCFEDPQTCWQPELAVATSLDGVEWRDISYPEFEFQYDTEAGMSARPDGALLIWHYRTSGGPVHLDTWTGDGPPEFVDPPEYPEPDESIAVYDGSQIAEVGDVYRYAVGLGDCDEIFLNGTRWRPEQLLPDPAPSDWPIASVGFEVNDIADTYLFATIEMTAPETVELSVGDEVVAVYRPAEDDLDPVC